LAAAPTPLERGRITHHLFLICHAGFDPIEFVPPTVARAFPWTLFINTAAKSPDDIYPALDGPRPTGPTITVESHSLVCFVAPERPRAAAGAGSSGSGR
jgi:hypothetical protein